MRADHRVSCTCKFCRQLKDPYKILPDLQEKVIKNILNLWDKIFDKYFGTDWNLLDKIHRGKV